MGRSREGFLETGRRGGGSFTCKLRVHCLCTRCSMHYLFGGPMQAGSRVHCIAYAVHCLRVV